MFISRILVPIDFSSRSKAALDYALGLARTCGACVQLLHVIPAPSLAAVAADVYLDRPVALISPEVMESVRAQMGALSAASPPGEVRVDIQIVPGSPARTITRIAKDEAFDLIILGTRARVGIAELVLGSVAHELMANAPCPIITMREPSRAAA